jgi:hypothetical protein
MSFFLETWNLLNKTPTSWRMSSLVPFSEDNKKQSLTMHPNKSSVPSEMPTNNNNLIICSPQDNSKPHFFKQKEASTLLLSQLLTTFLLPEIIRQAMATPFLWSAVMS